MPDLEKVDVPDIPASQLGCELVLLAVAGKEAGEGARAVLEREGQLHRVGILGPVREVERRDHPEREAPDTQDVAVGHLGHGARGKRRELAFDLVDLYARRSTVSGYAYREDSPWQMEMEAAFPYVQLHNGAPGAAGTANVAAGEWEPSVDDLAALDELKENPAFSYTTFA